MGFQYNTLLNGGVLCGCHSIKKVWSFFVCFLFLTSKEMVNSVSPKFIVTLDGVPSQLGNLSDCEMELDEVRPHMKVTNVKREPKVGVYHRLQGGANSSEGVEWRVSLFWNCLSPFYSSDQKCLVFLFLYLKIVLFVSCHLLTDDAMDTEVMDDDVPIKKQKVVERCKFWPVCKSGDECLYHHPTTQCK